MFVPFVVSDKNSKSLKIKNAVLRRIKTQSLSKSNLIIVIGGDGFMLSTLKKYNKYKKPFYGINSGNYGFLMNKFSEKTNYKNLNKARLVSISPLEMSVKSRSKTVKKSIAINFKTNGQNNYEILAIENRIEQIIANLLENSISFSEKNQAIDVELAKKEEDKITLIVSDEGVGFNENDTNKIFNRFYSNRPEKFGEHSGLGLNIVKSIVEMHGGNVHASNRTDNQKGAQIEVVLPKKYNQ